MPFMKIALPAIVIISFWGGLIAQFIWKIIYFPEPLIWILVEIIFITVLAVLGVVCLWKIKEEG